VFVGEMDVHHFCSHNTAVLWIGYRLGHDSATSRGVFKDPWARGSH
jgi:hypothetical protein